MPIKATFAADFSAFTTAVDKAIVSLKDFESNAKNVDRTLNRFGEQFSGKKVAQDAAIMARAVEEIGGVSKLTEKELHQVGAQAQEAIAKMKLMGMAVPENLKAIAKAVEPIPEKLTLATRATDLLKSSFGQMFTALSAANLVQSATSALIGFGKAAIDDAGHLVDLSDKTGIGIESLQEMEYAAEQTGGSLDSMTDAAFKLGVGIAGGGKSVRGAIDTLGLSFDALRQMKPEEQFRTIAAALANVANVQERNRLGIELFGKSYANIAATVAAGYEDLAAAAPKMGEAQARALDEAADAWDRFKSRVGKGITNVLGTFAQFVETLGKEEEKLKNMRGGEFFPDTAAGDIPGLPKGKRLVQPPPILPLGVPADDYIRDLADATLAYGTLTAAQKTQIDAATKLGVSQKEIADTVGVSVTALRLYAAAQQQATQASTQAARAQETLAKAWERGDIAREKLQQEMADAARADVDAAVRFGAAWNVSLQGYLGTLHKLPAAADAMPKPAGLLDTSTWYGLTQASNQYFENFQQYAERVPDMMPKPAGFFGGDFGKSLGQNFGSSILRAVQGGGNVLQSVAGTVGQNFTERLFNPNMLKGITSKLGGLLGGVASSVLPGIGALVGPAIEGLTKLFSGGEGKKVNDQRDAWIEATYGTSDNLRKLAAEAGATDAEIRQLFSVKKIKDFEKAAEAMTKKVGDFTALTERRQDWVSSTYGTEANLRQLAATAGITEDKINQLFSTTKLKEFETAAREVSTTLGQFADEQEADAKRLEQAIKTYGFTFEQLGPALQRQRLAEQSKELIEDWRVLIAAGVDMTLVNEKMATSVNEFLQTALKTGTEIPRAFKPILDRMAEQGTLTDEAGNAITDLSQLGIQYSETMTQGFDRVVTKLEELIAKLTGVGQEIVDIPNVERTVDVYIRYHEEDRPEGLSESVDVGMSSIHGDALPGFQHGTHGRYLDFGEGTPAMLHGKERIVTEDETTVASAQMTAMLGAVSSLQTALVRALRENALQVRDQTQLAIARA